MAESAIRVHQHDVIEPVRHVSLEQKRNVADHDSIAPLAGALEESGSKAFDFRVDDLIELFELLVIREYDSSERRSVEAAVGRQNGETPPRHDLLIRVGANLDGTASEHVGVDDRRSALG